jgi:predicted GNAT family N-acyltransferase
MVRPARDAAEVAAARELRVRVFCEEQGVDPAAELDSLDREATHVVALDESGVIATCRLRFTETDQNDEASVSHSSVCKLERMAVERRYRRAGAGSRLLEAAEQEARRRGASVMVLHAQRQAEGFYAGAGYEAEGEPFDEEGIEHVQMAKPLGGRG